MSFIDGYGAADLDIEQPQDPLDAWLDDHYAGMLGKALDTAAGIHVDIDQRGPFWQYLRDSREEAMLVLSKIDEIDAADAASIRGIQLAVHAYKSALGFARKLVNGIVPPGSDSADADQGAAGGVGEPLHGEAGEPG